MAKSANLAARNRRTSPPNALAPALRATGIRVGAALVVAALGAGVWMWREHRAPAVAVAPPPSSAVAAKPAPVSTSSSAINALLANPPAAAPSETATAPAPQPPRRDAALDAPKVMSASLRVAFDTWLMGAYAKCWRAPRSAPEGEPYLPKVRVAFKDTGELAAPPKLVNPPSDPAWKPHAEAALKAVKGCDPLHVPDKYAEYYPSWKSRTVYFDPVRN